MANTKRMEVVEGCRDLMSDSLSAVFSHCEFPLLKVGEKITSRQVLHHDINMVLILKDVKKSNYIGMLAHFENFNLPPL